MTSSNISMVQPNINPNSNGMAGAKIGAGKQNSDFADTVKAVEKYISKVSDIQQSSNVAIMDLLSGKNNDINSVVSAIAKADMSFKLLVGVRNKLIEAYKETMKMPL